LIEAKKAKIRAPRGGELESTQELPSAGEHSHPFQQPISAASKVGKNSKQSRDTKAEAEQKQKTQFLRTMPAQHHRGKELLGTAISAGCKPRQHGRVKSEKECTWKQRV